MKLSDKEILLNNPEVNFLLNTRIFIFVVISLIIVGSCNLPEDKKEHPVEKENKDSILKVRESLNIIIKQKLFREYFDSIHKYMLFNGNVLIAQKGQVIFEGCYGYKNFRSKDTLTPQTTFQLASVTKQFTAIGIMMLEEQGKLSFNDPVEKFYPDFPYPGITIHLLLCHRSGLPNYIYFTDHLIEDKVTYLTNQGVIKLLCRYKPPKYYAPDLTFDYSNTGYVVLAGIIEKVSGMEYSDFMKKNIFEPLGMKNTCVFDRNKNTVIPEKATGYLYKVKEADDNYLNGIVGDKGIYTTAYDMFLWDWALYSDKLLKRENIIKAFEAHGRRKDAYENYGYGFRMYTYNDSMKVIYHGGWWQGFQNKCFRIEKDSSAIIILKNKKTRHAVNTDKLFSILNIKDSNTHNSLIQ